ncbi:MAG TPA: hypothetical protein VHY34_12000 [Caulobacteraceae bacterium]|jgi:hypothetical protein|nr:hypothetical protein [Caulobacteraceae bacterium]
MPYVLKVAALSDLEANEEVEVTERCFYGGNAISTGDEAFLWFSGADQRLAWSAEVLQVEPATHRKITVTVRLMAQSVPDTITLTDLAPMRDDRDGSALSELSRKLYRHAHDKIAALSEDEAALLRRYCA